MTDTNATVSEEAPSSTMDTATLTKLHLTEEDIDSALARTAQMGEEIADTAEGFRRLAEEQRTAGAMLLKLAVVADAVAAEVSSEAARKIAEIRRDCDELWRQFFHPLILSDELRKRLLSTSSRLGMPVSALIAQAIENLAFAEDGEIIVRLDAKTSAHLAKLALARGKSMFEVARNALQYLSQNQFL